MGEAESEHKRPTCGHARHANDFGTKDIQLACTSDAPIFAAILQVTV